MQIEPEQKPYQVNEAWLDALLDLIPHISMTEVDVIQRARQSLQNIGQHPKIYEIIQKLDGLQQYWKCQTCQTVF